MENRRTSKGKQKIEMKKITKEEDLRVTFSKRRSGIYKKASELCILCDIDIGMVIFSPSRKPYSFASPNMRSVSDRLFKRDLPPDPNQAMMEAQRADRINGLVQELNHLKLRYEVEKERGKRLREMLAARTEKGWWESPIDDLGKEEVGVLIDWFNEMKVKTSNRLVEIGSIEAPSSSSIAPNPGSMAPPSSGQ
ncbi:hypothetical protein LguiA_033202 [Lonicera macranthoides]